MLILSSVSFSQEWSEQASKRAVEHSDEDHSISEEYYNILVNYCKNKQKSPDNCWVYYGYDEVVNEEYKTLRETY